MTPLGVRSVISGSVILPITAQFPQGSPASFTVSGTSGLTYAVTFLDGTLNGSNGGTMTLNAFTCSASCTGTFGATASNVSVGGNLVVGSGQAAGSYTGSYTVTVVYN
ncbi:MAG: DUF4402 domain-containing protein [Rhodoferax sp.]|nr:DUF4402 domain-containing protein [Rhodoferax sp.]